jgi:AcrR family transcriptional regulator
VCQKAELNPRYFYESFDDIDALLVAVYDFVIEGLVEAAANAPVRGNMSALTAARVGIGAVVRFVDEDRRRARILYVEALGNETLARHRVASGRVAAATLEQMAIEAAGSWPQGEHVGRVGAAMLLGGVSEVLLDWIDGRINVPRDQLVDDLAVLSVALGEATEKIARGRGRSPSPGARSKP